MLTTSFSKRYLRAGVRGLCLLSLAAGAAACSHPQYALGDAVPDGGGDDPDDAPVEPGKMEPDARVLMDARAPGQDGRDPVVDGGVVPGLAMDEPPSPEALKDLPGTYAIAARAYTRDVRTGTFAQAVRDVVYLGVIEQEQGTDELVLSLQRCRENIDTDQIVLKFFSHVVYPERLPATSHRVRVAGNTFRTESTARQLGFGDELPADCAPGKTVARPNIPWLTNGTCVCPAPDVPVPTHDRDCRVTDPDADGLPGYTVKYTTNLSTGDTDRYCAREQIDFAKGTVTPDRRHRALLDLSSVQEVELEPNCASGSCSSPIRACAAKSNPVQFVPLDGAGWDCKALVKRVDEGGLFNEVSRTFPTDC